MRLVTRSDFDGLVCGALLKEAGVIDHWKFAHPKDLQDGLVEINAVIYCEKASHKGIIIGKQGAMLREIGKQARDAKVYLELWVKVKEGWRNNQYQMRNFGYEEQ